MSDPTTRLLDLVDRLGLGRARDVAKIGIPTVYLTRLVRPGALERVARGLYDYSASVTTFSGLRTMASVGQSGRAPGATLRVVRRGAARRCRRGVTGTWPSPRRVGE